MNSDSEIEADPNPIDNHLHHHKRLHHHHHHHHLHHTKSHNKQLELFKRNTNTNLIQPTKKITNKLISFLRKLRNEAEDEIEEEDGQNIDVDDLDIEQISDFSDTELDDSNLDLYSIVSNPKPSIKPFFKRSNDENVAKPTSYEHYDLNESNYDDDCDPNIHEPCSSFNLLEDSVDNL